MRFTTHTLLSIAVAVLLGCSQPAGGGGEPTPDPTPTPTPLPTGPTVYVGGQKGGVPGYWVNDTWTPLTDQPMAGISAMAVSGTHVYGAMQDAGGYWIDGVGQHMTTVSGNQFASTCIAVGNGTAYVGGYLKDLWDIHVPRYWNGAWVELPAGGTLNGAGHGNDGGIVWCLTVDGSDVYAGGEVGVANGQNNIHHPGYWKNGVWVSLPTPTGGRVLAIAVLGNDVYAAGWRLNVSTYDAGYWLNGTWFSFGVVGWIQSVAVVGDDIYAAGWNSATGTKIAGYWKNGDWHPLGTTEGFDVYSIAVLDEDVYMSASVASATGGPTESGYWKNSTWHKLATGYVKTPMVVVPEE